MSKETIRVGAHVHYTPKKENGIVKSVVDDMAFVVYHWGDDEKKYRDFTGVSTKLSDLRYGWVDEKGNLLKEYCDHHYTPTNAKWQSFHQRRCQWCGDTID